MAIQASPVDPALWQREFSSDDVLFGEEAKAYVVQDFSWYSPLLSAQLSEVQVDAIVFPRTIEQLEYAISQSVKLGRPITMRGAGTGNYGQSVPIQGGLLVDMRNFEGVRSITDSSISMKAGTRLGAAENVARKQGRELRLLPTMYRRSHVAGFIGGGAGGLGSITYGMLWDAGNVTSAEVLSVEEQPRRVAVGTEDVGVLIHTYGAVAVMTELTLPVEQAKQWHEMGAAFSDFEKASRFCWAIGRDRAIPKRLLSLDSASVAAYYRPIRHLFQEGEHLVSVIVDESVKEQAADMVRQYGGKYIAWPENPEISQFSFAHSVLWAKHEDPSVSWVQLQWSADEAEFEKQVATTNAHFGDKLKLAYTFVNRGGTTLAPGSVGLIPRATAESIQDTMDSCRTLGIRVTNPHTYVVEEGGPIGDMAKNLAWKRKMDPHGLLNPGKLGGA